MMEFNEYEITAKQVAVHYSKKLKNQFAENIVLGKNDIASAEDAKRLTQFFWDMADQAAEDYQADEELELEVDLESCMERLMNIFIGYTKRAGFNQQWIEESNRINGS
ncbi:hypothetical protein [Microbulbifer sp. THAF38]|uniref:hypothetical protein n=1 Tax=Microbulbifer sp. THAF38 TaxID=2587856 RepID=UPI0012684713|nr:hypothetical protein [Microbulbifer sp. THAF38]QFT56312.1 hypothetical protein FIU95_17345 [Microbulbifer sp. THAF38]